jgi:hypothetical protein
MTGDIREERKADKFNNLETVLSRELLPTPSAGGQSRDTRPHGNHSPSTGAVIGMLPTPRAEKHTPQSRADFTPNLAARIMELAPTPSASMVTMQDFVQAKFHSSKRPRYAEAMLPTPIRGDWKGQVPKNHNPQMLCGKIENPTGQKTGLKLQPAFVEWMMGWPIGWTDLRPLEMDRFRQWWQQHGRF